MNVTVNILELASNLAHEKVLENFLTSPEEDMSDLIFIEEGLDGTIYSDEAQDVFNEWYDIYFDMILEISDETSRLELL